MRTYDRTYPQCRCARFGQSRFDPVKRTALDGKVWWCLYDRRKNEYVAWYKKKMRRHVLVQLVIDFMHGRLPYDPDPGFSMEWLIGRTAPEIGYLVNHRRLKDETY